MFFFSCFNVAVCFLLCVFALCFSGLFPTERRKKTEAHGCAASEPPGPAAEAGFIWQALRSCGLKQQITWKDAVEEAKHIERESCLSRGLAGRLQPKLPGPRGQTEATPNRSYPKPKLPGPRGQTEATPNRSYPKPKLPGPRDQTEATPNRSCLEGSIGISFYG